MKSIRSYLLSRILTGATVVLAVTGAFVYLALTRYLDNRFDDNLAARVQGFASILFQQGDEVEFEFSEQLMPEYDRASRPSYFQLWFRDGSLIERSSSLSGRDLEVPLTPTSEPQYWTAPLPDGRSGRHVAQLVEIHHVYPEEGPNRPQAATVLVVIADGREGLVATRRAVLLECSLGFLVLGFLIGGVAWTAVRRGLRPADRLAAALHAIDVDHLPERLDLETPPSELRSMAERTDELLQRVAAALERERRATADIAHELRTPISEMLTASEVALHYEADHESARQALRTVRDVAWRMGRSVATLLKLARLEMGTESFACREVDLGAIVRESLRSLSTLQHERALRVVDLLDDVDVVEGDPDVLRIVAGNLLSNALFYSPPGGTIECALERGDGWTLRVENEAPDLAPADLAVLSRPFWRKDPARHDREHSGLGLALSQALAERSGMRIELRLESGVLEARLRSERSDAAAGHAQRNGRRPSGTGRKSIARRTFRHGP